MEKKQNGFTLIELIIVILILGILAAIAFPSMSGFSDEARKQKAASNLMLGYRTAAAAEAMAEGESNLGKNFEDFFKETLRAELHYALATAGNPPVVDAVKGKAGYTICTEYGTAPSATNVMLYIIWYDESYYAIYDIDKNDCSVSKPK